MSCVKKIALTLSVLLALLVGNASAQCGGKTVYVQLPADWNKTAIYILWEGGIISANANAQGDYSVFTFPNAQNDQANKSFAFSMKSSDIDNGNRWIAAGTRYDVQGSRPTLSDNNQNQGISCSQFGATVTYIYPNPSNLNTTVVTTEPPNAYYFYYLPPRNDEWILGTSILVFDGETPTAANNKFELDASHCGWFRKVWFNTTVPDKDTWIFLNGLKSTGADDKVGAKGIAEDPLDWPNGPIGNPTPFNLKKQFEQMVHGPGDLYYDANGDGRWSTVWPGTNGVCEYKFAAVIYDSDWDVMPGAFKCGDYDNAAPCPTAFAPGGHPEGTGINRGIPESVIDTLTFPGQRKMKWKGQGASPNNNTGAGQNDGWTPQTFIDAFKPTPGKNVQLCYDMPFALTKGGLWEFDSDRLCANGAMDPSGTSCSSQGGTAGGFFPLHYINDARWGITTVGDYSTCPACNTARKAEGWTPLVKEVNKWCYDRGWLGSGSAEGNLSNKNDATAINAEMRNICIRELTNGDLRNGTAPQIPNPARPTEMMDMWNWNDRAKVGGSSSFQRNMFFCFESHAEFTYEEGQEFFFRGDDDIWVFMNNRLVIDLGGSHLAAPGYVKLDTIGKGGVNPPLVPGDKYPIDIFFCDARSTMSNVRITTNMYFSQQSGLYNKGGAGTESKPAELCMLTGGGGGCADVASGSGGSKELCGDQIRDKVEYFLENRRGDIERILFTPPNSPAGECTLNGNILTCYGGVKIDLSQATASVNKEAISGITGSWTLYARVKDDQSIPKVKIASFSTTIDIRMAWGTIKDDKGAVVTDVCNYTKYSGSGNQGYAVTGERFPVCFGVVEEIDGGFEVNPDGSGSTFTISTNGFRNEFGNYSRGPEGSANAGLVTAGLRVYLDSNSTNPLLFDEVARQFTIPSNGVLVLWVTGGYEQRAGTHDYTINVSGKTANEVTLHSLIPMLQWTKALGSTERPCNYTGAQVEYGSKLKADGCAERTPDGKLDYIWVGEDVNLSLRAFNEKNGKTCKTCNFTLRLKANATPAIPETDGSLINYSREDLKVVNGEAGFGIKGYKEALITATDPDAPKWVTTTFLGPESDHHQAVWDSLQFRKPPVPLPEKTWIYDDNGDGIGDRMVILYSRGFRRDSLPNMLEVKWDPDTTVLFGLGKLKDGRYPNDGISAADNITYWSQPEHQIKIGGLTSTLDGRDGSVDASDLELKVKDTIILLGQFSKKVLTQGDNRKVNNWATFRIGTSAPTTTNLSGNIEDRIPAIITTARYEAGGDCGNTVVSPCRDRIVLEFSEPVKMDENAINASEDDIKNPFAYRLIDLGGKDQRWDILKSGDLPSNSGIRYGTRTGIRPTEEGDATVTITFNRYRDGDNKSGTPMPGDSVKFAARFNPNGYNLPNNILVDLKGNAPNINEIGREIGGRKPFNQEKIPIAELDPNYPDYVKDINNYLKENGSSGYDEDKLFSKDRPVELLPVPPDCNIDCVRREYPGTIGIVLSPDISNAVSELESQYPGVKISDADIVIHPQAFYHTNLGSYVADNSGFSLKCNDPIFPVGYNGQPSCRDSKSQLYIAWNMKDMKGRFVGAGAYVGIYDFYWEVNIPSPYGITQRMESIERKVEMHGVKRVKKR